MRRIMDIESGSALVGELPEGCRSCGPGRKMVLLVTGKCTSSCFYCPLSEKKRGKDVVYANELSVKDENDIITEAKLIGARGCSMTGGDPLCEMERTTRYIRLLKEEFGSGFHVHLYTSIFEPEKIKKVADAGLDEIRLHPYPIIAEVTTALGDALETAVGAGLDVGVEIPAIPNETEVLVKLVKWLDERNVKFINLNELEFSHTNWHELEERGFEPVGDIQWGVKGSRETAIQVMEQCLDMGIAIHFCSSSFKDAVQLKNRLRNRAEMVARDFHVVTDEGLLLKGIIEGDTEQIVKCLKERHGMDAREMHIDQSKSRVEIAPWILEEIAGKLPLGCFIIEEYPTADMLEVERVPLNRIDE